MTDQTEEVIRIQKSLLQELLSDTSDTITSVRFVVLLTVRTHGRNKRVECYLPCARPQSKLPRLFTVRGRTS